MVTFLKKHIIPILSFFISTLLIIVWFKNGMMLAKAEEGLPFYNLERTFNVYKDVYIDTDLGKESPLELSRIPILIVLSWLQKVGFSSWMIEATLYWFLIFTPLTMLPLLINELFPRVDKRVGLITALFYLFNIFTLTQVWNRFVLSLIFLWSYLPLFLYTWVKILKERKAINLVWFGISSILFSTSFVILSPAATIWVVAGIVSVTIILKYREKLMLFYALLGFFVWLVINMWWIRPVWSFHGLLNSGSYTTEANLLSLTQVSKYFDINNVLTLTQKYQMGELIKYLSFYKSENVTLLFTIIFLIVAVGISKAISEKKYISFVILFILGLIICKGTSSPFGKELYTFLFNQLPLLAVFRNPYEKFGSAFLLPYSFFFAYGVITISALFGRRDYYISLICCLIFCVYLMNPIWTGKMFENTSHVSAPTYYETADKYIKENSSQGDRIYHLPWLAADGILTDWNYKGEEPSAFLFDNSSISRNLYGSIFGNIYDLIGRPEIEINKNYPKLLSLLGIKYIILHNDYLKTQDYLETADDIRAHMSTWRDIKHISNVGKLEIYKLDDTISSAVDRIYFGTELVRAKDLKEGIDYILKTNFEIGKNILFVENQNSYMEWISEKREVPNHIVERLSSTEYKININNAKTSYILVLQNIFSPNWQIDGVNDTYHFIADGYANGWIIDKKGDYIVNIKYTYR
jgi:hypothetical protein